jgi:hypothetical protein
VTIGHPRFFFAKYFTTNNTCLKEKTMARLQTVKGAFPHVEWMDLNNNGTITEVAVVRKDGNGNVYFFELNKLDAIDRQRLFNIISKRHAPQFQLWDLLSQHTLGNGMNALDYFHQLVKIQTPSGSIIDPKAGVVGVRPGQVRMRGSQYSSTPPADETAG